MNAEFEQYSDNRIRLIRKMKDRVKTLKPDFNKETKQKIQKIFLIDFVVYACLRGVDYRKTDHTGGEKAKYDLETFVDQLTGKNYGFYYMNDLQKFVSDVDTKELVEILKSNL